MTDQHERTVAVAFTVLAVVGVLFALLLMAVNSHRIERPPYGWVDSRGQRAPKKLVDGIAGSVFSEKGGNRDAFYLASRRMRDQGYKWAPIAVPQPKHLTD